MAPLITEKFVILIHGLCHWRVLVFCFVLICFFKITTSFPLTEGYDNSTP